MAALLVGVGSFLLFLFFQTTGIYGGDSGDLVTAAATFGIPHPPGYPLYTFLGYVVSRLPLSSVAWRVGLLSSLAHAATIAIVYSLVRKLTRDTTSAMFSVLFLAGNYLFFLYSVTPEVFGLFDLFVVGILFLLLRWEETRRPGILYVLSFVFGLALAHHHLILFLVPAMWYFIAKELSLRGVTRRSNLIRYERSPRRKNGLAMTTLLIRCGALFLFGLLPYLYIPIAARAGSMINWDHPTTLARFFHLILRKDYGTFVANNSYGALLTDRMLGLKAYAEFVLMDVTAIGVLLGLIGLYVMYKKRRIFAGWFTLALLFLGPVFFFYASFPLANNFTLATFERFLLPSYVLLSILVGAGVSHIRRVTYHFHRLLSLLVVLVLFLYPLTMLTMTLWRFWGLRWDRTADNFGADILATAPDSAIILLNRDTPLFITQYVRYGQGLYPDTIVLHTNLLSTDFYLETISPAFPALFVPPLSDTRFMQTFVQENNRRGFPIYSVTPIILPDEWFWVPEGLLYRLYDRDHLPSLTQFEKRSDSLWAMYHDPGLGIVSRYPHLMLSDIRNVYANARLTEGNIFVKAGAYARARESFVAAVGYKSDVVSEDAFTMLGLTQLFENNCDGAREAFRQARIWAIVPQKEVFFYEASAEKLCGASPDAVRALYDQYVKRRDLEDTPLEQK